MATTDQVDEMEFVASTTPSPEQKMLECDEVLEGSSKQGYSTVPCCMCAEQIRIARSARFQCSHRVCVKCANNLTVCPVKDCGQLRGRLNRPDCSKCGTNRLSISTTYKCGHLFCVRCDNKSPKCLLCAKERPVVIAPPKEQSASSTKPAWPPMILCDVVLRNPQKCPICNADHIYTTIADIKQHLLEYHRFQPAVVIPLFRTAHW